MARARRAMLACALAAAPVLSTAACGGGDDAGAAAPSGGTAAGVPGGATATSDPFGPTGPSTPTMPTGPTTAPAGGATVALDGVPTGGIGETVTGDDYEVVVRDVTAPATPPNPTASTPTGYAFLRVDIDLTNVGASPRDATYLRFEVHDAAGTVYRLSRWGEAAPTGWIPPDDTLRISQLFEVPQLATGLVLTLRPDVLSEPAVAVRLT